MSARPIDPRRIELLDPALVEIFRAKTPAERVAMACESNLAARRLMKAHLTASRSSWSADRIEREIAGRMLHGTA